MFAFVGFTVFEATAVFRDEARDPDRTIPRATYIAVISIGLFCALSTWAIAMGSGVTHIVSDSTAARKKPRLLAVSRRRGFLAPREPPGSGYGLWPTTRLLDAPCACRSTSRKPASVS